MDDDSLYVVLKVYGQLTWNEREAPEREIFRVLLLVILRKTESNIKNLILYLKISKSHIYVFNMRFHELLRQIRRMTFDRFQDLFVIFDRFWNRSLRL